MDKIFEEIKAERQRQDSKFGVQNHQPADYLMILAEEVGEANKAALEHKFCGKDLELYRNELIQVAAVAVAMIQCYDKNNGKHYCIAKYFDDNFIGVHISNLTHQEAKQQLHYLENSIHTSYEIKDINDIKKAI